MNTLKPLLIGMLLFLFSCKSSTPVNNATIKDITGCFYVIDDNKGVEIYDKRASKNIYIDTAPIFTDKNFALVETRKDIIDHDVLDIIAITLDKEGTKRFAVATKKYYGKKIAFLLFGRALFVPLVQSEIKTGKLEIMCHEDDFVGKDVEKLIQKVNERKMH